MGGLRSSVPLGESLPGLLGHKLKYDGWRVACFSPRWEAGLIIQFRSLSGRWASLFFSLGQLYKAFRITLQERILLTISSRYINQESHRAFSHDQLDNFLCQLPQVLGISLLFVPGPRCHWMDHTTPASAIPLAACSIISSISGLSAGSWLRQRSMRFTNRCSDTLKSWATFCASSDSATST